MITEHEPLVFDVMNAMESIAPAVLAESWDKIGLQVGDPTASVRQVLIALDVTRDTLRQALERQASLIVCHHPLIFTPLTAIRQDDPMQSLLIDLIQARINVFVAHTNLDAAPGGVADCWAVQVVQMLEPGSVNHANQACQAGTADTLVSAAPAGIAPYGRLINLRQGLSLREMLSAIGNPLPGSSCRINCSLPDGPEQRIQRIATFPGSFPIECLAGLSDAGAEAVICGEINYHDGLLLGLAGIIAISVGHDLSEQPALAGLANRLVHELPQISFAVNPGMDYNKQAY